MKEENPNKCLYCDSKITESNKGIMRNNFKYDFSNNKEVICLKCYNKGINFNNMDVRRLK